MISNAWFTVNYFNVSFGKQDIIQDAIRSINTIESISIDEKRFRRNRLTMTGKHETGCCFEHHCEIIRGSWQMELYNQEGEWLVVSVDVEGVDF
jgi:hypothetical protein